MGLSNFATLTVAKDLTNWPRANTNHNDNAKDVADYMIALNKDEKTVVAGHLAKSIEGEKAV